jgi:metal-dependent hydrolase (beta-lactamase superfamily II)
MSDAVRGSVDCKREHGTVIGVSDIQPYHCTQIKNVKHFDKRVFSECSGRMFSG